MDTALPIKSHVMNKQLLKRRFCSAKETYVEHAAVQAKMAVDLVDLAKGYVDGSQVDNILELGSGTGLLTKAVLNYFSPKHYAANDLVPCTNSVIQEIVEANSCATFKFIAGDIEAVDFPKRQHLICSGATIQWIKDLGAFFNKMHDCLQENGYLILSSFGPDNYTEIKEITTHGIAYPDVFEVMQLASDYFEVVDQKEWHQQLYFKSAYDVLKHMRYTGVNGTANCKWTKRHFQNFVDKYENYRHDAGYPLTYHPYLLVLKRK